MNTVTLLPIAQGSQVASYLWRKLSRRRLALAGVLLLFLLESATALIVPLVIGQIVDGLTQHDMPQGFPWMIGALLFAALSTGVLTWLGAVRLARVAETIIAELREDFVEAALKLPRSTVESAGAGDVVTRASDDISEVSSNLPEVLPRFFVSTFTIVLIASTLITLDWRFLLTFLLCAPLYVLTVRWYVRTAPQVYQEQRAVESIRGQHILGTLDNLDTVLAHRIGGQQLERIEKSSWDKVRWAMRTRIIQNRMFGRLNISQGVGLIAVLSVGMWLAFHGEATAGAVTAAALLFQRIVGPVQALIFVMDDLQAATSSLSRLVGVIDVPPMERHSLGDSAALNERSVTRVSHLGFSYPGGREVLKDVNLEIRSGETIAVVGATGSGKSTLAALVAGVYQPQSGVIERGIPANQIYSLSQETHVFMGTVRANLTVASPDASEDELHQALQSVGAGYLVDQLSEGLDTVVGQGGLTLEPAQAQHLALARLHLLHPQLVILDEATAEADSADAGMLDCASRVVTQQTAALIIAHRLSQVVEADRIVVMDRGRIVENGTHEELLATQGVYSELWQAWSAGVTR